MTSSIPAGELRSAHVRLHPLAIRPEGDDYVVGCAGGDEFVLLPAVGVRAIELLEAGMPVAQVSGVLASETGEIVDVAEFVESLAHLGFVAELDGVPVDGGGPEQQVSLRWLQPRHIQWLFTPPMFVLYASLVTAAVVAIVRKPSLLPSSGDFFWSRTTSLVIAVNTGIFLLDIAAHETAHLVAARSRGVGGRITLGTRLYNLVAQTDISGLWGVPRRQRFRGYLAGMTWDLGLCSASLVALAFAPLPRTLHGILAALVLMLVVGLASQFQLYMRTDMYFVLADLLDAKSLFGDSMAYTATRARRIAAWIRRRPVDIADPLAALPPRERRCVRMYTWFMIAGSGVALAVFAFFIAPVVVDLLVRATRSIIRGIDHGDAWSVADGSVTWLVEGGLQIAFLVVFARTHRNSLVTAGMHLQRIFRRGHEIETAG